MARDTFLDQLIGEWSLSGQMGNIALRQCVSARWVLNDLFVEVRCEQIDHNPMSDRPPYEAIYLIGFDDKADTYVFHLFDTFGVTSEYRFGTGKRNGNLIPFLFPYSIGLFWNTLEQLGDDEWRWLLESDDEGARKTFATKHMTRNRTQ